MPIRSGHTGGGGVDDLALCLYSWRVKTTVDLPSIFLRRDQIVAARRGTAEEKLVAAELDGTLRVDAESPAGTAALARPQSGFLSRGQPQD